MDHGILIQDDVSRGKDLEEGFIISDSMTSFNSEMIVYRENVPGYYLINYIGPKYPKFALEFEYPYKMYTYNSIQKGYEIPSMLEYKDQRPLSLLSYIFSPQIKAHIDTSQIYRVYFGSTDPFSYRNTILRKNSYLLFIKNTSFYELGVLLHPKLAIILEGKTAKGDWRPIEYSEIDFECGVGKWYVYLQPSHYIVTKIPVYSGSFKTLVRCKLYINGKIFYSNEINMKISEKQFIVPNFILENKNNAVNTYFMNF